MEKNISFSTRELNENYLKFLNFYIEHWDKNNHNLMFDYLSFLSPILCANLADYVTIFQRNYLAFLDEIKEKETKPAPGSYIKGKVDNNLLGEMKWEPEDVEKQLASNYVHFILEYYTSSYNEMCKWNHLYLGRPVDAIKEFTDLDKFRKTYTRLRNVLNETATLKEILVLEESYKSLCWGNIPDDVINKEIGQQNINQKFFQLFLEAILNDAIAGIVSIDEKNSTSNNTQFVYWFGLIDLDENRFEFDIDSLKKLIIRLNCSTRIHDQEQLEADYEKINGTSRVRTDNKGINQ